MFAIRDIHIDPTRVGFAVFMSMQTGRDGPVERIKLPSWETWGGPGAIRGVPNAK